MTECDCSALVPLCRDAGPPELLMQPTAFYFRHSGFRLLRSLASDGLHSTDKLRGKPLPQDARPFADMAAPTEGTLTSTSAVLNSLSAALRVVKTLRERTGPITVAHQVRLAVLQAV